MYRCAVLAHGGCDWLTFVVVLPCLDLPFRGLGVLFVLVAGGNPNFVWRRLFFLAARERASSIEHRYFVVLRVVPCTNGASFVILLVFCSLSGNLQLGFCLGNGQIFQPSCGLRHNNDREKRSPS